MMRTYVRAWLIDVTNELNNPTNVYQGFDITAASFPSDTPNRIGSFSFSQHNAIERFPAEFHAKFDLINVRLVIQAFKAADVPKVISNLVEMLRPGGFLQWGDLSWIDTKVEPPHEDLEVALELSRKHMRFHGVAEKKIKTQPSYPHRFHHERTGDARCTPRKKSTREAVPNAEEEESASKPALLAMLPKVSETQMLSENKPVNTAEIDARRVELAGRFEQAFASGYTLTWYFCLIVGKKPLA
ncbi:hypothetical protein BDBG_07357 [Blastomyces gilchristii SLH14081]|uniref:Methyltransferase domain-containing protein n=1 Tax=Blastomyces gilchristii (strain SLH14081) TaxID=559298 RepID=A0A179UXU3_BLAGS|nr:uncharacterized protein BDBG_07357 [Blastomyces gilchristii SLH14081]OAT11948.1 hypothetical protein BDBG_07357 [Blastomyces gilchristii SLH14081]